MAMSTMAKLHGQQMIYVPAHHSSPGELQMFEQFQGHLPAFTTVNRISAKKEAEQSRGKKMNLL
jgi:hypothetical protein